MADASDSEEDPHDKKFFFPKNSPKKKAIDTKETQKVVEESAAKAEDKPLLRGLLRKKGMIRHNERSV